jgi:ribosomal protein L24
MMHTTLTRGQVVEITRGARDGQTGVVAQVSTDLERYRIILVRFTDGVSAWYGEAELVAR